MTAEKSIGIRNTDPLGSYFRDRLKWSPLQFGLATLLANIVIDFAGAWRFDAFVTRSGQPGLFQDIPSMFVDFVMIPVISGYYIWTISGARSLLEQLRRSNILAGSTRFASTTQDLESRLRSRLALASCLGIALIVTLLWLGNYLGWISWGVNVGWLLHSRILPLVRAPMWFLGTYALCFVVFNVIATIVALRDLFRDQLVELSPWHPDRCGGLRGISQYSLTLSYGIAVVGISLSIMVIEGIRGGTLAASYFTWMAIATYVILAPLVFFLPLGTAHLSMRRAKDRHLLLLAERFDAEYRQAADQIDEAGTLKSNVEKMEQLRKLYKITEEFPVWPFDVTNLRRFLTVITAPLAPGLVSVALDLIGKLLAS